MQFRREAKTHLFRLSFSEDWSEATVATHNLSTETFDLASFITCFRYNYRGTLKTVSIVSVMTARQNTQYCSVGRIVRPVGSVRSVRSVATTERTLREDGTRNESSLMWQRHSNPYFPERSARAATCSSGFLFWCSAITLSCCTRVFLTITARINGH